MSYCSWQYPIDMTPAPFSHELRTRSISNAVEAVGSIATAVMIPVMSACVRYFILFSEGLVLLKDGRGGSRAKPPR